MKNPLEQQLEEARFNSAIQYIKTNSHGIKHLSPSELAYINQIIDGQKVDPQNDPWRSNTVQIKIRTGQIHQISVISNPLKATQDIISQTHDITRTQSLTDAALYIYTEMIKGHFFKDANRRTAVAATLWIVNEALKDFNPTDLYNHEAGDIRDPEEFKKLKLFFQNLIK